jgi:periplasmic divalent cation tolerance protein
MSIVTVYCDFADADEAKRIGRAVVEDELAACINILAPCRSMYRWNGKVEDAPEVPAILKTTAGRADALVARIAELHSYDVPCITVAAVDKALPAYAEWIAESVPGE